MGKINIINFDGVYEPAEDSWLISRNLPDFKGTVLEIGCGSGIVSIHLAKRGNIVTAIDINAKAVEATIFNAKNNNLNIETIEGNMFTPVQDRKFENIVCNPPYLPPSDNYNDPELELAVEGGNKGIEFTKNLLSEAHQYLESAGSIYMIQSSKMGNFETKWQKEIIKETSFFFERLYLVRFFF